MNPVDTQCRSKSEIKIKQLDLFMEARQCQCQLVRPKKDLTGLSLGFHKCLMRNDCFQLLDVWKTENRGERLRILTCLKYKSQLNHGFVRKVELIFDLWKERTLNVKTDTNEVKPTNDQNRTSTIL